MAERTPWALMLSAGVRLGIAPPIFWRLSLREWRALNARAETSLSRAAFDALAQAHPDKA